MVAWWRGGVRGRGEPGTDFRQNVTAIARPYVAQMRMMSSEPGHRYLVFAEDCEVGISFITLDRMRWAIVSVKPAGRRTSEERCQERHSSTYLELNARA